MANPNPNPKNRFKKGHVGVAGPGRPAGAINVISRDIKTIIRKAAEEVGFIRRVPVLDAEGKPTGRTETRYGEEGELGYIKWLLGTCDAVWQADPARREPEGRREDRGAL